MAAGLLALNEVFGPYYDVSAAETKDPEAFAEKWPKDQFIFDVQTHHVDVSKKWYDDTEDGKRVAAFFRMLRRGKTIEDTLDQLNRVHYVKELFGDSDTVMAVISQTSFASQTSPIVLMMARRSSSFLPRKGNGMPTPKSKPSMKKNPIHSAAIRKNQTTGRKLFSISSLYSSAE